MQVSIPGHVNSPLTVKNLLYDRAPKDTPAQPDWRRQHTVIR